MKPDNQTELTSIKTDDNYNDLLIEDLPTQDSISPWSLLKSLSAVVFSKENRSRIIGATIVSAAHTGITLLSSYLLSKIIQNVTTPDQPTEILGREFSSGELLVLIMISNFLSNQLPDTRDQLMAKVTANNTSTLIKETTEHVLLQSLSHHLTAQPSDHAFLIQKGFVVPPAVTLFLTAVFPRVLQVIMATIFLSVEYDPYIGISLPALLLLQLLYCRLAARFILDVNLKLITTGNDVWGGFIGAVANYKIVHDYQKLEDTIGKLKIILQAWNEAFTQSIMKPLLIGYGQNILSYGHCGLASYYVIYNLNERFTPHDFVIIFSYLLQLAILSPQFAQAVVQLIGVYPDQGSRYLVIDFSHPWPKSTRQRAKCLAATVLRPARCPERASVCLPQ